MAAIDKHQLPTEQKLQQLLALTVKDEAGKDVTFESLVNDAAHPRVVTVFIRHFFCGFCEAYLAALEKDLSAQTLQSMTPPTKLIVIGCGDAALITDYKKRSSADYQVYADYDRKTYGALDFVTSYQRPEQSPDYIKKSFWSMTWNSMVNNMGAGSKLLAGGKISQNGGEMIWEGGKPTYMHRMQHTQDHMSVADLKQQLEQQPAQKLEQAA